VCVFPFSTCVHIIGSFEGYMFFYNLCCIVKFVIEFLYKQMKMNVNLTLSSCGLLLRQFKEKNTVNIAVDFGYIFRIKSLHSI